MSGGVAAHPGWRVRAQAWHPVPECREKPAQIRTRKAGGRDYPKITVQAPHQPLSPKPALCQALALENP